MSPKATVHGGGTNLAGGQDRANEHHVRRYNETGDVDLSRTRSLTLPTSIVASLARADSALQARTIVAVDHTETPYAATANTVLFVDVTHADCHITLPTPTADARIVIINATGWFAVTVEGVTFAAGVSNVNLVWENESIHLVGDGSAWREESRSPESYLRVTGEWKALDLSSSSYTVIGGFLRLPAYASGARPAAATAGAGGCVYDTTLSKPIWSDGAAWRDAAGSAV